MIFFKDIFLEQQKVLLYFVGGIIWIYPSFYLSVHYCLNYPYFYIVAGTLIFITDGGAYFGGKLLGNKVFKRKLAPTISPNKTIEGTIIGILTAMLTGYLISFFYFTVARSDLVILGLIYGVFGQLGDLVESSFKRWVRVKDTGTLMPGMGGINDRADSLYLALPAGHLFILFRNYHLIK